MSSTGGFARFPTRIPCKDQLNRVELTYDDRARQYRIVFVKTLENTGQNPIEGVYARIDICAFPTDPKVAQGHHFKNPIQLREILKRVEDDSGARLDYTVEKEGPSNIEFYVLFRSVDGVHQQVLYPGQKLSYTYTIELGDHLWGPYLERHIRLPTDRVEVQLRFRQGVLSRLTGKCRSAGRDSALMPAIQTSLESGYTTYRWASDAVNMGDRFRFNWSFEDGRDQEVYLEAKARGALQLTALGKRSELFDDAYRTVEWNGRVFQFTNAQAACIRVLDEHGDELTCAAILERAGLSTERLPHVFRKRSAGSTMHEAWGTLIVATARGRYRLKLNGN